MRNPKTTIAGGLLMLGGLSSAAANLLLGHTVDWSVVGATLMAGVGLIAARDGGR